MPEIRVRHERRAETLSPVMFYTVSNRGLTNYGLNAGATEKKEDTVQLGESRKSSSENWQFFLQSDRYFIRNFDRGADMQLGLSEMDRKTPKLYHQSGDVSQQWNLTKVGNYWHMANGLEPGVVMVLAPGLTTIQVRDDVPEPNNDWQIQENPSALTVSPLTGSWTTFVSGFVSATSSPSASRTSVSVSPTNTNSLSPSNTSSSSNNNSPAISGGAIAGIAIGAVVLIGALVFALWFFLVKRRQTSPQLSTNVDSYATKDAIASAAEKYTHQQVVASPPVELATGADSRVELDTRESSQLR